MLPFMNGCSLVEACSLGFVHSSSSLLVLCSHLSATASNSNLPYLEMANFHKALNAKLMFIGLKTFLTDQDWPYTSAPEMASNMQVSTYDNFINAPRLHSFMSRFPNFLETLCLYFEKYVHTSVLLADFCINRVKYGRVGRSAIDNVNSQGYFTYSR